MKKSLTFILFAVSMLFGANAFACPCHDAPKAEPSACTCNQGQGCGCNDANGCNCGADHDSYHGDNGCNCGDAKDCNCIGHDGCNCDKSKEGCGCNH